MHTGQTDRLMAQVSEIRPNGRLTELQFLYQLPPKLPPTPLPFGAKTLR
jgi:hypothetical protein